MSPHATSLLRPLSLTAALLGVHAAALADPQGQRVIATQCAACHVQTSPGHYNRISDVRKTPEGWDMTVARMGLLHGVKLSPQDRQAVVKQLADTQGLAPSESAPFRYILEQRPSVVEQPWNPLVADTCTRCHSVARIGLQHRTEADWRKLVHFHVGQFPTIELHANSRDRNWFDIARQDIPKVLAKTNALQTKAWKDWQATAPMDPSGTWRVAGHRPGWGDYEGEAEVSRTEGDLYTLRLQLRYADGRSETAQGKATLFNKYEWRASVQQGDATVRQVLTLSEGGTRLQGRWYVADTDALGGDLQAWKQQAGQARLVAVQPAAIHNDQPTTVRLIGQNLQGDLDFGPGVKVEQIVSRDANQVVAVLRADAGAKAGAHTVQVGSTKLTQGLFTYPKLDYIKVLPENPIARVGGNGGSRPKVPAQLEAVGYLVGPDGKPGTADDIAVGVVPASWQVGNLNENAEAMKDKDFAGHMEANGLFWPGDAGPNPKRKFSTNNAGELKATATYTQGPVRLDASVPLMVTVQRWNDPPVR